MKNILIGVLTSIIYYNTCITANNDTFAIAIGAACTFGCVYFFMREIDKWNAKKHK